MPSTIRDLTELTAVASDDYFLVSDTSDTTNRDKRISRANLLAAVSFISGTPTAGRVASWLNGTTIQDGGFAVSDIARLSAANTYTTTNIFQGLAFFKSAVTDVPSIADSTAYSTTPLVANGMILVAPSNDATVGLVAVYRAGSGAYMTALSAGSNTNVSTAQLLGTTGTTGKVTVSASTDGKIYIENRRGATLTIRYLLIG